MLTIPSCQTQQSTVHWMVHGQWYHDVRYVYFRNTLNHSCCPL